MVDLPQRSDLWVITILVSGTVIGFINKYLIAHGIIAPKHEAAVWWVIAVEYAAYFTLFDTWFYWLHRWMQ